MRSFLSSYKVCVYACARVCECMCMCLCVYLSVYVHTRLCVCTYVRVCEQVWVYACTIHTNCMDSCRSAEQPHSSTFFSSALRAALIVGFSRATCIGIRPLTRAVINNTSPLSTMFRSLVLNPVRRVLIRAHMFCYVRAGVDCWILQCTNLASLLFGGFIFCCYICQRKG